MQFSIPRAAPVSLNPSSEMKVYALFGLAMALTTVGVFMGTLFAPTLFRSGMHIALLIAELGIVFSARYWITKSPLNSILFGLFPLLSGITITPYLWYLTSSVPDRNVIL